MYFWRIDRLKRDLASGAVSDGAAFPYILAYLVMIAVCAELGRLVPEPLDAWRAVTALLIVVGVAVGTYFVYRANGGAEGREFANRFFSLAFVFTLRFVLTAGSGVLLVSLWWTAIGLDLNDFRWLDALIILILVVPYYWRLAEHLRHVADAADGRAFHRSIARGPVAQRRA